jgi:hypothetical protein
MIETMKHFNGCYNLDARYYYSCDYPGCTKTRDALRRHLLNMPSGWFKVTEKAKNGERIEKHYCIKHYNVLMREKRRKEAESVKRETMKPKNGAPVRCLSCKWLEKVERSYLAYRCKIRDVDGIDPYQQEPCKLYNLDANNELLR